MSQRKSGRKSSKRKWYDKLIYIILNNFFRVLWMVYLRLRSFGAQKYPLEGAVLICSNHQSHLDPILVANSCTRYISFVARDSLFKFKPFGWLISSLGAFPINRDKGIAGIKLTLQRLKNGEAVLIFPEGTRTPDGEIKEFKSGFCAIARRAKVPIVPVAIEGAFAAWPKSSKIPLPGNVQLKVGDPITIEQIAELSDDDLTKLVQGSVETLRLELKSGQV